MIAVIVSARKHTNNYTKKQCAENNAGIQVLESFFSHVVRRYV